MMLTIEGKEAVDLAEAAGMSVEVLVEGAGWTSMLPWQAARVVRVAPKQVRMIVSPRVLAERLLRGAIPDLGPGALPGQITDAAHAVFKASPERLALVLRVAELAEARHAERA